MSGTQDLTVVAVTNPVRSIAPFVTFADSPRRFFDVDQETVKAALLYGDHVSLRTYLLDIDQFARWTLVRGRMPLLYSGIPITWAARTPRDVIEAYGVDSSLVPSVEEGRIWFQRMAEASGADRVGPAQADSLLAIFDAFEEKHGDFAFQVLERYHFAASEWLRAQDYSLLQPAIDQGLLTVTGWSREAPEFGETEQNYLDRAGNELLDEALSDVESLPLLDAGASTSLLQAEPLNEVQLAQGVLRRMPEFSRASITEILDIRQELAAPLVRFRSAMVGFRRDAQNNAAPDISEMVRDFWTETIEPELLEIDELTKDNKYLGQLADSLTTVATWIPEAAGLILGFGLLEGAVQITAAVVGLMVPPVRAARQKQKQARVVRRRDFYLLHKIRNLTPS